MKIDLDKMVVSFQTAHRGKATSQDAQERSQPPIWRYDYLILRSLSEDISLLIAEAGTLTKGGLCLDIGCNTAPYASALQLHHYRVESMDIEPGAATHVGFVERIPLESNSFDAVLCTQVLEHCDKPWQGVGEIARILKPGGVVILSGPHVWFFHPHPKDHWRFTQQGIRALCLEAGLEIIQLRGQLGSAANLFQVINFLAYGVLGNMGAPFYFILNLAGLIADRMNPNDLFCGNFACLARKP